MRALSRDGPDRITIAAPSTTIADVIAPFLAEHGTGRTAFSAIEESVDTGYQAVVHGRADIALTISQPPAELARRDLHEFRLFAYVAKSDPWSQRTAVQLEELSGPPLIVTPHPAA
jgi:DNA-binding transcriptional LysR family regulator